MAGVNVFITISAYFLLDSPKIKWHRVINIVVVTSLYSVITYVFSVIYLKNAVSVKHIIKALLSPFLNNYWFVTGYLILYVTHPILNKIIEALSRDLLRNITLILAILFFGYKFLYVSAPVDTVGVFVSIYFFVAYYKKYVLKSYTNINTIKYVLISIGFVLLIELLYAISEPKGQLLRYIAVQTISKFSPFMFIIAIGIFDLFIKRRKFQSSIINRLSMCTLAVYVIHESDYISAILWNEIFKIGAWYNRPQFIIVYGAIIFVVFWGFAFVDIIMSPIYGIGCKIIENIFKKGFDIMKYTLLKQAR